MAQLMSKLNYRICFGPQLFARPLAARNEYIAIVCWRCVCETNRGYFTRGTKRLIALQGGIYVETFTVKLVRYITIIYMGISAVETILHTSNWNLPDCRKEQPRRRNDSDIILLLLSRTAFCLRTLVKTLFVITFTYLCSFFRNELNKYSY